MASSKSLKLKLLIDKEKKKVIFAESDKDFVDILFSFLTMPLGSLIHILDKQTLLGCVDNLYKSIKNLDQSYFSTEACKEMLLRPLNASSWKCEDLILRIDESNPRTFFTCKECVTNSKPLFSLVANTRCGCGEKMDFDWYWQKTKHKGPDLDGVFLKGMVNFMISDDLVVMPASTTNMYHLIERNGIRDLDSTEEICIDVDATMFRDVLVRSLISKIPLSDIYFQMTGNIKNPEPVLKAPKIEDNLIDKEEQSKKVKIKVLLCKPSNKVLYAEAEGDFVNLLFSILTLPLGTIVKLLNGFSSIGCLDNLYKSAQNLCPDPKYFKPGASNLLLHPKLAAHFSCSNSLFSVSEKNILIGNLPGCHTCLLNKTFCEASPCEHGMKNVEVSEINPKLSSAEVGGSYTKREAIFLITDDLHIKPFSSLSSIQTLRKCNASFATSEEKEIEINESDALNLLKSCLTSENPLSKAFLPKFKRKRSPI